MGLGPPPKPMCSAHLSWLAASSAQVWIQTMLPVSLHQEHPPISEPRLWVMWSGGTTEMRGMESKKASPPIPGSCPHLRPQQPLIPKETATASLCWEPATPKHPNRAAPRLKEGRKTKCRNRGKRLVWPGERHTLSPL